MPTADSRLAKHQRAGAPVGARSTLQIASSIEPDPSALETACLLGTISAPIEQRLERWLNALVLNWREGVPHEA